LPSGLWAGRLPLAKSTLVVGRTLCRAELLQQRPMVRIERKRASRPEQAIGSFFGSLA
jgi:hypothetical protein